MESCNGQWYCDGSVCFMAPGTLGSHEPPKQHPKVQRGVWQDVGVLSIHDDHEDFYQHLPRPAPGASITHYPTNGWQGPRWW